MRDKIITHTAVFPDGIEIDIGLLICDDDTPYTEGVLFRKDCEVYSTEPQYANNQEWLFAKDGRKYKVNIIS